jgi:acetyl-CoA acetyltransferase
MKGSPSRKSDSTTVDRKEDRGARGSDRSGDCRLGILALREASSISCDDEEGIVDAHRKSDQAASSGPKEGTVRPWLKKSSTPNVAATPTRALAMGRAMAMTLPNTTNKITMQLYDGFTVLTIVWLEALVFCGRGESGPFIEGGANIARDGLLPLNTAGGQLSGGRPHGFSLIHETCVQLRGEGGSAR